MKKIVEQLFPALQWIRSYSFSTLPADAIAGMTVAVMLVPQAMAYSLMAGLSPIIGLYASTIPILVYAFYGSSKHLSVGPVAMISMLVYSACSGIEKPQTDEYLNLVLVLTLFVGCIQIIFGIARLGFLTNFFSEAVIHGFTSAAAIIIGVSQLKHIFGISIPHSETIVDSITEISKQITHIHGATLVFSVCCIGLLFVNSKKIPLFPMSLAIVIIGSLCMIYTPLSTSGIKTIGTIPSGLPHFAIPSITLPTIISLYPAAFSIFFVGFIESIAIAKVLSAKQKYSIDSNQELIALGLANSIGSLFSAYPVTGGLSRSAVNFQAGAKTQIASIITSVIVIITVLFLTPLFRSLPNAVLASIVIVAIVNLIDFAHARKLFAIKQSDGWIYTITFTITLLKGVEFGILSGFVFSLLIFILRSSRPTILELGYLAEHDTFRPIKFFKEAQTFKGCLLLRIDRSLYFANMNFFAEYLHSKIADCSHLSCVIIDMSGVNDIDAVAITKLDELFTLYATTPIAFYLVETNNHVLQLLKRAGCDQKCSHLIHFFSMKEALKHHGFFNK